MSFGIDSSTGQAISNALLTLNNGGFDTSFTGEVHQNSELPPSSEDMEYITDAAQNQPNPEGNLEVGDLSANATNVQTFSSMATSLTRKRSVSELPISHENKKLSVDPNKLSATPESSSELQYNVPTGNKFSLLGNVNAEIDDTRFAYLNNTPNEDLSHTVKIPPIYVSNITNISNFTKELKYKVSNNFVSDVKYDKVKINAKTPTDFRNIVKYLIETQRSFHSYKDPSNKKFSVVFKNLHQSITESEIILDLKHRYPSILKVTRLQKDGNPIPVVAAEFNGSEPIDTILSIDQICNHRVSVERRKKPKGPLQCQRCLDFGHTKNNCNHVISCAFCAGNHYSVKCPKKNETPTCALCKGDHRADIRNQNCAYFKELSERKTKNSANGNRIKKPIQYQPILAI